MRRTGHGSQLFLFLSLIAVSVSLGFGPASTAVERLREGIKAFAAGDFESAGKAFTEADVAEPENPTIAFDRACALSAAGDVDKAKELFREAALARDTGIASRSHYNLGCLSAEQGRAALGDHPVAATPEQREQGMSLLLSAVGHYRDCLKLDTSHVDARHNLELIRLFIKHIQAQWQQQDREKAREEMNLLEFLAMIEQRQIALQSTVRILSEEPDSPQRRQTTSETSEAQAELNEEIEPLKEKIAAEFMAAQQAQAGNAQPGQPPVDDSQAEQAQKLLKQLADEAGGLMVDAASRIESTEFADAEQKQRDVLDRLNQIFMAVAPFSNVLQRATQQQEQLTATSEATTATNDEGEDSDESDQAVSDNAVEIEADLPELQWKQSQVTDWSRMLSLKAQAELPGVESQLQSVQTQGQPAQTTQPDDDGTNPHGGQPDPSAQLEAMKKSLEKAIELAPRVVEHSTSAAESLGESDMPGALPDQQEALKLLREIAETLSQQNQQNDNQQDGDGNDQQQDQQQSQNNNQEQQNNQNQQQKQQQGQSPQERAMSVLRKARERERQHRDLQKQLQQMSGGRVRVDRDW